MRESNFAFPAQNKACVCITSQLYDRRALDTTSALPLFNSLTHLTYLTSTSPRIREIMTMDGGLERLVRMLHDFCMCPPPPDNPAQFYGLAHPTPRPIKLPPTLNPPSFDKHAAYRFSLAFQCVVNIGVRGSEPIRSRVVQAGTLDVVGCILEAWLANKGFAVGPSANVGSTREQRHARRLQRQRDDEAELARALHRQIDVEASRAPTSISFTFGSNRISDTPSHTPMSNNSDSDVDADTSADPSTAGTPARSSTPTGTVVVPGRERSGTIIARPMWDQSRPSRPNNLQTPPSSRPDTETEDDDVDMDQTDRSSPSRRGSSPDRHRRAIGIVSEDAHIIINHNDEAGDVGVEDGIVSLEQNDDFAMGAPPGAPGAIAMDEEQRTTIPIEARRNAPDATPRAGVVALPMMTPTTAERMTRTGTLRARGEPTPTPTTPATVSSMQSSRHHHRDTDSGPYRDEDVLLSLQLLAYLSKYPHVRQAFYKQRTTFHPASANLPAGRYGIGASSTVESSRDKLASKDGTNFFKSLASRGKEKEKVFSSMLPTSSAPSNTKQTNVFSLVERFTFRPSSAETDLPRLPPEIQYWAGVIMRNACRKDESRGGIRQCANMLCGKWEEFPREFAKCRRCRKAKYCGKECQSTAWSEGHRFWCSAKEGDEDRDPTADHRSHHHHATANNSSNNSIPISQSELVLTAGGTVTGRTERRSERYARERTLGNVGFDPTPGSGRVRRDGTGTVGAGPSRQDVERRTETLTGTEAATSRRSQRPGDFDMVLG